MVLVFQGLLGVRKAGGVMKAGRHTKDVVTQASTDGHKAHGDMGWVRVNS